jgi:hypothetical protein
MRQNSTITDEDMLQLLASATRKKTGKIRQRSSAKSKIKDKIKEQAKEGAKYAVGEAAATIKASFTAYADSINCKTSKCIPVCNSYKALDDFLAEEIPALVETIDGHLQTIADGCDAGIKIANAIRIVKTAIDLTKPMSNALSKIPEPTCVSVFSALYTFLTAAKIVVDPFNTGLQKLKTKLLEPLAAKIETAQGHLETALEHFETGRTAVKEFAYDVVKVADNHCPAATQDVCATGVKNALDEALRVLKALFGLPNGIFGLLKVALDEILKYINPILSFYRIPGIQGFFDKMDELYQKLKPLFDAMDYTIRVRIPTGAKVDFHKICESSVLLTGKTVKRHSVYVSFLDTTITKAPANLKNFPGPNSSSTELIAGAQPWGWVRRAARTVVRVVRRVVCESVPKGISLTWTWYNLISIRELIQKIADEIFRQMCLAFCPPLHAVPRHWIVCPAFGWPCDLQWEIIKRVKAIVLSFVFDHILGNVMRNWILAMTGFDINTIKNLLTGYLPAIPAFFTNFNIPSLDITPHFNGLSVPSFGWAKLDVNLRGVMPKIPTLHNHCDNTPHYHSPHGHNPHVHWHRHWPHRHSFWGESA